MVDRWEKKKDDEFFGFVGWGDGGEKKKEDYLSGMGGWRREKIKMRERKNK